MNRARVKRVSLDWTDRGKNVRLPQPGGTGYDQFLVTHETGHLLGLGHPTGPQRHIGGRDYGKRNRSVYPVVSLGLVLLLVLLLLFLVPRSNGTRAGVIQSDSGIDAILVPPTGVSQLVYDSVAIFVGR